MLGIHSFTLSLDPPSLILYCLRKTGSGLHDYINVLLSGFFLVASRTPPVEFGDERFSWKNRVE